MIRSLLLCLGLVTLIAGWPALSDAQVLNELFGGAAEDAAAEETPPEATTETETTQSPAAEAEPQEVPPPPDTEWERLASRAERMAMREDVSRFALNRLRAELVQWRDRFLSETSVNGGRIATVNTQIAALGPAPDSGEEAESVANRRAQLVAQRLELIAPRLLAEEAYARANGLIGELDTQLLQRQTGELTARGATPLDPEHLLGAATAVWSTVHIVTTETASQARQSIAGEQLMANLPRAIFLVGLAIVLLGIGRRWITARRAEFADGNRPLLPLWLFILSLAQMAVPVAGLWALTTGLQALPIFGVRGSDVISAIPRAGFLVVFAWWLGRQLFPVGMRPGYLGYCPETRATVRRYGLSLAWVLAIGSLFDAALRTIETSAGTRAAIEWPVLVILGLLLWRLGRAIRQAPTAEEGEPVSPGRTRGFIGRLCIIVAIAAPTVAAFGYVAAGRALMIPSILSLSLIGVVMVLQRVIAELGAFSEPTEHDEGGKGVFALLPVLVSFVLYVASLPIFALIWGARVDDLLEVWARFREGFAIGDTRISPTDFLTFALVFALGFLLTRFIQGTLRRTVMPRTRLDLGGQNAVVAGFGYVGVILAAIIAITSAGIDLSSLAIVAGALSVGIGFGLQNIVSNFVSGIILLIERPVSEGDWIEVGGQMGYVRSISVRSTRIETFDRTDVIVPNADLVSGQVTNWTRGNLIGRVIVPVGVAYGTDVDKVTEILKGIAEAHPMVLLTPPPSVVFQGFGADSLNFEIRAILRDVNYVLSTKSEMNHEIAKKFGEAGIEIPFAQRDIWLRNPEVLKDKDT
ncbi:mechanosensitive ion channel family protein [Loktanella agnita]|uniref:mechanosensitive ion channel family protein n=1 Tax=Loktanella agnita TaxID=287097 RepID=UPI0039872D10